METPLSGNWRSSRPGYSSNTRFPVTWRDVGVWLRWLSQRGGSWSVLAAAVVGAFFFQRVRHPLPSQQSDTGGVGLGSVFDTLFQGPTQYDNEMKLRPVSVNNYVYIVPTHQNEDGIFVKLYMENSSELTSV